jgi:transposase
VVKGAIVALAKKILVIIYNMLKKGTDFDESYFNYIKEKQESFRVKKVIAEAGKLGLEVIEPLKTA